MDGKFSSYPNGTPEFNAGKVADFIEQNKKNPKIVIFSSEGEAKELAIERGYPFLKKGSPMPSDVADEIKKLLESE